ncbi:MAG: hypothetical protein IJ123_04385 [Blautia sp.]|nr:hypothetical protein [Blautia sp.]
MDEKNIMEYANKAIEAFKGDKSLLTGFSANPVDIIQKVLGIDLPDDIINKVIEAVKSLLAGGALDALGDIAGAAGNAAGAAGEAAEQGGSILSGAIDKIKSLF